MKQVAHDIPGYTYGAPEVSASPITLQQLEELKASVGMTAEEERYLRLAGDVLVDQTAEVVDHWRGRIVAGIPNLARHSRTPEGNAIPEYASASNLRFRQWILDTC
ncbi:MAG: protogloblin ApPgb, partial [Bryobacteraceae bacterium]